MTFTSPTRLNWTHGRIDHVQETAIQEFTSSRDVNVNLARFAVVADSIESGKTRFFTTREEPFGEREMMSWHERISVKPDVCHAKVCITGTRVMVTVILDNLADGVPEEETLRSYPTLTAQDIKAAIHYASDLASGRVVTLPEAG